MVRCASKPHQVASRSAGRRRIAPMHVITDQGGHGFSRDDDAADLMPCERDAPSAGFEISEYGNIAHKPLIVTEAGPRSGPGYSVPVRHHLIGPIRPTRGHIAISPPGGLYAMPSLLRERLGDPRAVPGFRCTFRSDMPPSTTPGSSNIDKFQSSDVDIGLRRVLSGSALPRPRNPFHAGLDFRGFSGSHFATACQIARSPARI